MVIFFVDRGFVCGFEVVEKVFVVWSLVGYFFFGIVFGFRSSCRI